MQNPAEQPQPAPPPDSAERTAAERDRALSERFAQIEKNRAEHDRAMSEFYAQLDKDRAEHARAVAEQHEKQHQALMERFASVERTIDRQTKKTKRMLLFSALSIIAFMGVCFTILGAWVVFLESRDNNTFPAVGPVTIQYLSPQTGQIPILTPSPVEQPSPTTPTSVN